MGGVDIEERKEGGYGSQSCSGGEWRLIDGSGVDPQEGKVGGFCSAERIEEVR